MALRCGGVLRLQMAEDDRDGIAGRKYCMSSLGGGKDRSIGEKQDLGWLEGRVHGVGGWQPTLQYGLMFKTVSSGVRLPGFESWLYH